MPRYLNTDRQVASLITLFINVIFIEFESEMKITVIRWLDIRVPPFYPILQHCWCDVFWRYLTKASIDVVTPSPKGKEYMMQFQHNSGNTSISLITLITSISKNALKIVVWASVKIIQKLVTSTSRCCRI